MLTTLHCMRGVFLLALLIVATPAKAQVTQFSGRTSTGAIWNRPETAGTGSSGSCDLSTTATATQYEVIPFSTDRAGGYVIHVAGAFAFETFILLYEGAFDPSDPCRNLIALNGLYETTWGKPFNVHWSVVGEGTYDGRSPLALTVGTEYHLVVTGRQNNRHGDYAGTIRHPDDATIIFLNALPPVATFSGNTTDAPTWHRPGTVGDGTPGSCQLDLHGANVRYQIIGFETDVTGPYVLQMHGRTEATINEFNGLIYEIAPPDENVLYLYEGGFDPSDPCAGLVAFDVRDGHPFISTLGRSDYHGRNPLLLDAGQPYYLVATGDVSADYGPFDGVISSDFAANITFLPPPLVRLGRFSGNTTASPTWNVPEMASGVCTPGSSSGYEIIPFHVDTPDDYVIRFGGDFDAVVTLYTSAFDPANPCDDLIEIGTAGASNIGEITARFAAGLQYYAVVSGPERGAYEGRIDGPIGARVSFPAPATVQLATFSGDTGGTATQWYTPVSVGLGTSGTCTLPLPLLIGMRYEAIRFTTDQTGIYVLETSSFQNAVLLVYDGQFDATDPCENLIAMDDEGASNVRTLGAGSFAGYYPQRLQANRPYYLIVTSSDFRDYGPYTGVIRGPAGATITTDAPTVADLATFSGSTLGGPRWARPDPDFFQDPIPCVYSSGLDNMPYQVVTFKTDLTGDYVIRVQGDYDTFIFLYEGSFDPTFDPDPSQWTCTGLIAFNDDDFSKTTRTSILGTGPSQGRHPLTLTQGTPYFLVVTGFRNQDAGAYDGVIRGPVEATIRFGLNAPPVADAGADKTVVAGMLVALEGSASDEDGDDLTFAWSLLQPDGSDGVLSDATAAGPTFCAALPGTYTATLVVSDGTDESDPDDTIVTVITASEALSDLSADVSALSPSGDGTLNQGQTEALIRKLDQTKKLLARGKTSEALAVLADLRLQVLDLQTEGVLSEAQATALVESADFITDAQANPCSSGTAKTSSIAQAAAADLPADFALDANYPNPFNPSTEIGFSLPEAAAVRLVVYDVLGRAVARLVDGPMAAGRHQVRFDASHLPSGTYLYRIETGSFAQTRRMVLVR